MTTKHVHTAIVGILTAVAQSDAKDRLPGVDAAILHGGIGGWRISAARVVPDVLRLECSSSLLIEAAHTAGMQYDPANGWFTMPCTLIATPIRMEVTR